LKDQRWVPYIALEAFGWLSYAHQKSRGRALERDYRDLAWNVARRVCDCNRRDTVFSYYEAMSELDESGFFDADRFTDGVQPETNPQRYNGQQWERAKALHLSGQEPVPGTAAYDSALAYYQRNAVPDGYRWDWRESPFEQEAFNRLIAQSDDALRTATRALGLILANHVVSAIDALVTARLQMVGPGTRELRIHSGFEPAFGSWQWTTRVRIGLRN
jgi:hypothetical protein